MVHGQSWVQASNPWKCNEPPHKQRSGYKIQQARLQKHASSCTCCFRITFSEIILLSFAKKGDEIRSCYR